MSVTHKHSANKALAFKLASDRDNFFSDESSLESSDSQNSEKDPCFCAMEIHKIQEKE